MQFVGFLSFWKQPSVCDVEYRNIMWLLPRIQILQHDNHRIHAAEQCWAAMYNFTDFIFLLIYLLIFLFSCWFDTLKAMWNNAVSFIFAGCVVRVFLFYFETFSVHVLAFFKNATFICFSRDRMVYRNTHQHVCVPFFFFLHVLLTRFFSTLRKKNETPNGRPNTV